LFLIVYGLIWPYYANICNLGLIAVVICFILNLNSLNSIDSNLIHDGLAQLLKTGLFLTVGTILALSIGYASSKLWNSFEFVILILLSTISMSIMISSNDCISLYLSIELQSLCFYVLAASHRNSHHAIEAGLKYFVLGALASGILLIGMVLIYFHTGLTCFDDLRIFFLAETQLSANENIGLQLGLLCVTITILFKLTAAPFHFWSPDVYSGAPMIVTAFFATAPKIGIIAVLYRLSMFIPTWVFIASGILSLVVGAFGALGQTKLKRLFAFSGINHVGYILLAFACSHLEGFEAIFGYLIIYLIMGLGVFSVLLALPSINYASDLSFIRKSNPVLAMSFTLMLFSLAGIPPLAGFVAKFNIFFAVLSQNYHLVAVIGILTSCISAFYYLRLIKIMHFSESTWNFYPSMNRWNAFFISFCLFFLLFGFANPSIIYALFEIALCETY
jgi:proton-translocating NADH-quinone oxidoreductase chain N